MKKTSIVLYTLAMALSGSLVMGQEQEAATNNEAVVQEMVIEHVALSDEDQEIAAKLNLSEEALAEMLGKQLFEFTEDQVGDYIAYAQEKYPDLRERITHLARKNIGQPYELYLLGEFPFENYDPQPLYCIDKSDCVVFSEHTYAMALTDSWPDFFRMLQRIRYTDGEISVLTRNHYTEADWNVNNSWLVEDITEELAGEKAVSYDMKLNRASFLKRRYGLDTDWEVQKFSTSYIRAQDVEEIADQLQPGDFVNVIRGPNEKSVWAGHVGMITKGEDGTTNFLHSTPPNVREQPLAEYIEAGLKYGEENPEKASLKGFKFLRLNENALENLEAIDGPNAPVIKPLTSKKILAVTKSDN